MRRGPYEILSLLGEGGSGQVYRAWDPRLEREVALKVLRHRSETDPDRVRRFIAEARAASALNHPNIVRGTVPGSPLYRTGGSSPSTVRPMPRPCQ